MADVPETNPATDTKPVEPPPVGEQTSTTSPSTGTPVREDSGLRDMVVQLQETVNAITEQLSALAPSVRDSTPVKRSWLHRGGS